MTKRTIIIIFLCIFFISCNQDKIDEEIKETKQEISSKKYRIEQIKYSINDIENDIEEMERIVEENDTSLFYKLLMSEKFFHDSEYYLFYTYSMALLNEDKTARLQIVYGITLNNLFRFNKYYKPNRGLNYLLYFYSLSVKDSVTQVDFPLIGIDTTIKYNELETSNHYLNKIYE